MAKFQTHYDNLQVAENAGDEVIKGAYKYLSQKWHPDKNPDQRERAERVMKLINEAYSVLSNPVSRREHDAWIARMRAEEAAESSSAPDEPAAHRAAPEAPRRADPDGAAIAHRIKTVANARWPIGFIAGMVGGMFLLGLLLQVDAIKAFLDAHYWVALLGWLSVGIGAATHAVEQRSAELQGMSAELLDLTYQEHLRKTTVRQVVIGVSLVIAAVLGLGWYAQKGEGSVSPRSAHAESPAKPAAPSKPFSPYDPTPPVAVPPLYRPVAPPEAPLVVGMNQCEVPVRLLLMYKSEQTSWRAEGWWTLDPNINTQLKGSEGLVRSTHPVLFFRAETADKSITWYGNEASKDDADGQFDGHTLRFKRAVMSVDEQGRRVLRLTCKE